MHKLYSLTFGNVILSIGFLNGAGAYIESVGPCIRTAEVELAGEIVQCLVEYSAISFKLPLLNFEIGKFNLLEDATSTVEEIIKELKEELEDE